MNTQAPATEAQINYVAKLIGQKNLEGYDKAEPAKRVAFGDLIIPKSSCSVLIKELLALPNLEGTTPAPTVIKTVVPEGRYALRDDDGVVRFYKVDRPTEGRWAGRVFVKQQASDDTYPVRGHAAQTVLSLIEKAGINESLTLYGMELGHCGHCGRTLTDEASRARGIGPICLEKLGY